MRLTLCAAMLALATTKTGAAEAFKLSCIFIGAIRTVTVPNGKTATSGTDYNIGLSWTSIGNAQDRPDKGAIVADRDLRGGAEFEGRSMIDAAVVADADRLPVVRQTATQGIFSVTCAGLPVARAPGATSRASTVPAQRSRRRRWFTPLRMMAPVPIHT
jgi:hypothetical protein